MKFFGLSLDTLLLRYFLMMAIIIVAGFVGQWWLAILAFPIFMSTIMGISFKSKNKEVKAEGKMVKMQQGTKSMKEAV
ncbi:MAG: hypothetical protein H6577_14455 [Lewinellaceae bacterium]|nr:hypothetical protein [Saprospiraceae bacterium]MCB9339330.1 hypothetical protein [Lewinellaceae bacterium]